MQRFTHQNARACHFYFNIVTSPKPPGAFGKMLAILVQVKCLGAIVEACNAGDRKGDSVVPRSEAGEDARVEVQHTTSSTRTITIVVVGQERVKCHSLGRCDTE